MTKEKRTFAWDTVLTMSSMSELTSIERSLDQWMAKKTVQGTDIEVVWCPITRMYWEVQTMKNYKLSYKYWLGYIVGTIERFVK